MKLRFLSLCFSALILFVSCTKEQVPPSGSSTYNPNNYAAQPTVTASGWVSGNSMTWSDTTDSPDGFIYSSLIAPELTNETITSGAVLVYGRTASSDMPKLLPAMFEETSSGEYELYRADAVLSGILVSHTKFKDNSYVAPSVNNNISFRYIIINNIPPSNARIATNSGLEYSVEELKSMSYAEVTALLNIID